MQSSRSKLISFKCSNTASKTETNRDNTNRETGNPDIINHPGNAETWKSISFKLSNAELEQTKSSGILVIWNPVHLVQGSTRWYVLVQGSTYLTRYKAVRETSKWYIPVRTYIENSYVSTYQYILVCTALYLHGTMWYKEVYGDTGWYIAVQSTVHGGTWRYKAVQESFKLYCLVGN